MAMRHAWTTELTLSIALALVLVPATTMASHNSFGATPTVSQADEVASDGTLLPDVPPESPVATTFHGHLDQARDQPRDQAGDRYTECQGHDAFETPEAYETALREGAACYIGFMDAQLEYILAHSLYLTRRSDDGIPPPATVDDGVPPRTPGLYQVNPAPGDDHCRGDGDPVERVDRAVNDPACSGSDHTWFIPGPALVDTDLLEAGVTGQSQGNPGSPTPGLTDVTGSHPGSGTLSLPLLQSPYLYLFGQAHPDNPNPSEFTAGSGPFGPSPLQGGLPLHDIGGACGERTQECRLLTPTDIQLYDRNTDNLGDVAGFGEQARVCDFRPQFVTVNPDDRAAGLCGVFGSLYNQFLEATSHGGLGVPGVPDTWQTNLPGWYEGVLMVVGGEPLLAADVADESTDDGEYADSIFQFTAVNPKVPGEEHPLWCVRPNFLAQGGTFQGVDDPGMYGAYIADGVDTDIYRISALADQYREVNDATYPVLHPLYEIAVGLADDAQGSAEELLEDAELPPGVEEQLVTAADQADYLEADDPPTLVDAFTRERQPGIACDAQGVPQVFGEPLSLDGQTVFNAELLQTTVSVKDPTLFTDQGPAGESETREGGWMVERYSFEGSALAFLDTSQDATHGDGEAGFSGCATANGQPQPQADFCVWEGLWDAYNPECTNIQSVPCGEILSGMGYDLSQGVGLWATWTISGPVVVTEEDATAGQEQIEDHTHVLGVSQPTGQSCIVGFSIGLADVLGSAEVDRIIQEGCPEGVSEEDGTLAVMHDAFDDQDGVNPGSFSADIQVLKLAPTPAAVIEATGLGAEDRVCVTGLWNVVDGEVADDTAGNIQLTDRTTYTSCQAMASTTTT